MRPAILFCLFVIFGYLANAQFTILPQVGVANYRTSVEVNEHSSFTPLGTKLQPQAAIRVDYKFKKGYGPYLGMATGRSITKFNFTDPENVMNAYTASKGNTQVRFEGGFLVSTKPIYFIRSPSANESVKNEYQKKNEGGCRSQILRNSCGSKNKVSATKSKDKGAWVRVQPSLGVAYNPFTPQAGIYTKSSPTQTSYQYNAGNWKTALVSGVGFEFGANEQRKFVVSVNYLKGLSNLGTRTITTVTGSKSTTTSIESEASGWNVMMGIPISLNKKKVHTVKRPSTWKNYNLDKKCGQYKKQCRPGCSKVI